MIDSYQIMLFLVGQNYKVHQGSFKYYLKVVAFPSTLVLKNEFSWFNFLIAFVVGNDIFVAPDLS